MEKIPLALLRGLPLVLLLIGLCASTQAQTTQISPSKTRGSQTALICTKDAECPSGQRCGFTSGRDRKGKCMIPSHDGHCLDPGGRCGCDGRPVDIFCAVGSRMEYTSAPACFVGPCPKTCTEELGCGKTGLVCQKGICVKPEGILPGHARSHSWRNIASLTMPAVSSNFRAYLSVHSEKSAISLLLKWPYQPQARS
jgi:hypothetical protein